MISIWQQHEYRTMMAGYTLRYLRFLDKQRIDSEIGITSEERTELARLYNRMERGAAMSDDEMRTMVSIADKRNRYAEYGACFVPALSSNDCRTLLDGMPRATSEELEKKLEEMCDGIPEDVHDTDIMIPLLTVLKMEITTLDNMTLQQGVVIVGILSKAMEANK